MLLILAHAGDAAARSLAARWGPDTLLLTPTDLASCSWHLAVSAAGAPEAGLGPASQRRSPDGVLTRLGGVSAAELGHLRPPDRDYAAAELTAFLFAWLGACSCPVLNPPGPGCLNGPGWAPEHWARAASDVDLAVRTVRRPDGVQVAPAPVRVTVVGERWFGPVEPLLGRRLCDLARRAGTPLLGVGLDGDGSDAALVEVTAWPDVGDAAVADAVLRELAAA